MKNGKLVALLIGVLLVLAGTVYTIKHLRDQEQQAEATYGTEMPRVADIVLKTIASGSVQPRQEILIKPQVSGIVRRVLVEAGDAVEAGDVLAEVMIVPDVAALSNAESRLARAQITLDDAQLNHDRNSDLLARGVLAPAEAQRTELALKQAREELYAAEDNLRIVQEGVTARGGGNASNTLVKATCPGWCLRFPSRRETASLRPTTSTKEPPSLRWRTWWICNCGQNRRERGGETSRGHAYSFDHWRH